MEPCLVDFVHQFGVQAKLVVPIIQPDRQHSADREDFKAMTTQSLLRLLARSSKSRSAASILPIGIHQKTQRSQLRH
jgi:hypothetical protein